MVVIVSNCTLLFATNTHTVPSLILITLSMLSFFVVFYLENLVDFFPQLYQIFDFVMSTSVVYFLLFISSFGLFPVDKMIHYGLFDFADQVLEKEAEQRRKEKERLRKLRGMTVR